MRRAKCPISKNEFDCPNCDWIGKDGKCSYMKADEWVNDLLKTVCDKVRKDMEAKYEKNRD